MKNSSVDVIKQFIARNVTEDTMDSAEVVKTNPRLEF